MKKVNNMVKMFRYIIFYNLRDLYLYYSINYNNKHVDCNFDKI